MIASLTGRLRRKANDYLIVDVAGVGYQVQVPLSTYCRIPEIGDEISLHIHTHVREDALSLFGFLEQSEKEMFLLLMGVSGIGPKLALSVLSCLSVDDLCSAIYASDDSKLCTISGIGKKTAARMVLELKDKIRQLATDRSRTGMMPAGADDVEDAISALVNLGYKKPLAEDVLKKIRQRKPGSAIEDLIREALSVLMKK
ncbi:MAG TPA: Holliday junction branch migration protein RuvA [Nitrospirota bacterium]|nr:Holliday junction branch migration protein RuvA [Nitrospirota bacterium]